MKHLNAMLERLRCRVESALRKTGPSPLFSLETALLILSVAYGGVIRLRGRLYAMGVLPSQTLDCRVVSVGNIVAGGTGKTPMTIFVAQCIREMGYRVVVISRGYRGRMEASGGVVSDGRTLFRGPAAAGDEPYLMARGLKGIPVVVGRRRYAAGLLAIKRFQPDVIVLDDAFQHLRLKRDLDIVLLDSRSPFGNGHLLPRGLLREPRSALGRAQALVFTRSSQGRLPDPPVSLPAQCPLFHSQHTLLIRNAKALSAEFFTHASDISPLKGKKAVAFSGLADNGQFFDALKQAGCTLAHTFSFSDHHRYDGDELDRIDAVASGSGADAVVTTLKDFVKIETFTNLPAALVVVDVAIGLTGDRDRFRNILSARLTPVK